MSPLNFDRLTEGYRRQFARAVDELRSRPSSAPLVFSATLKGTSLLLVVDGSRVSDNGRKILSERGAELTSLAITLLLNEIESQGK